jgi:SnoaL-like domain
MDTVDQRLRALEGRIRPLEDQAAIYQLMAAYGPAADSGSTERATSLWAEDGIYDLHIRVMTGRGEIAQELEGDWHQGLIAHGSGHIVSMPYVVIDGDAAVATCHSRLYRREGDAFQVISCSANRVRPQRTGLAGQAPDFTQARRIGGLARAAGRRRKRTPDLITELRDVCPMRVWREHRARMHARSHISRMLEDDQRGRQFLEERQALSPRQARIAIALNVEASPCL